MTAAASSSELVTIAKRWQHRLGVGDWPAVFRIDDVNEPTVTPGPIDLIVFPAGSSEPDIVWVLLRYAFHNVPADRQPADHHLEKAAVELAACWQDIEEEDA